MIVVQETHIPGATGLLQVLETLGQLRKLWTGLHGSGSGGRLLAPYSGLPRQAIWQFQFESFGHYEKDRAALDRLPEARPLIAALDRQCSEAINNFYSVVGDDDTGAEVRSDGIVVQARYIPRHGQRARTLELLRTWQRDWAAMLEPEMKGRVLGFTSTGVTHDVLWQAEYPSAGAYETAYKRWSTSDAFEAWARDFRDSYVTNTHAMLRIVEG